MTSKPVRFLGPAFFYLIICCLLSPVPSIHSCCRSVLLTQPTAAVLLAQGAVPLLRSADGPTMESVCEGIDESRWSREKSIRSSLLRQGLPEREAVEGDAPEGAAAKQRGVDGSLFCAEGI